LEDVVTTSKALTLAPIHTNQIENQNGSKEHVATGWATACSFLLSMATVQPFKAFELDET